MSLWLIILWNIMLNTVSYLAGIGGGTAVCFENIHTAAPFDSSLSLCCSLRRPNQDQDLNQWSPSQDWIEQQNKTKTRHTAKSKSRPRHSDVSSCWLDRLPSPTWNFSWINYTNRSALALSFCTHKDTDLTFCLQIHPHNAHTCAVTWNLSVL